MRIGIIGTRGIPNKYGGFEEFAENLSLGLAKEGFDVTVYCSLIIILIKRIPLKGLS
ncbi:MAG: DUF1972 domain-containing protein [Bacteroidales bacterium]|nr:DUF1972 domain-containing protein [Bacteroidales bacterium]